MNVSDFIRDNFFSLPKTRTKGKDFNIYIIEKLNSFLEKLKELAKSNEYFEDLPNYSLETIIIRQTHLINQIRNAITYYYDGKPASALNSLGRGLKSNSKDFEHNVH